MNEKLVNKPFVSKLSWDDLNSIERTVVMEMVRSIDEVRELSGAAEPLEVLLKSFSAGLKDELKNVK